MHNGHTTYFGKRASGISLIGDLPWGSHFCQFYDTREDLLETLAPYFEAGLGNNEFCVLVTDDASEAEDADKILRRAVPRFEECVRMGQAEVISRRQWLAGNGQSASAVVARLDKAVSKGFDGLRLAYSASPDGKRGGDVRATAEAIGGYNVIALFAYPRDRFDAAGLLGVVKSHQLALVKNLGQWEVLESAEARTVKDALRSSEEKLRSVFANMSEGFAYHRIVLDGAGKPCDYVFLEINAAFERLTGLSAKDLMGKRVTEALPGIEQDPANYIARYGTVALTGEPTRFETCSQTLGRWYSISAFSPHKGFFAVTFTDITERKASEAAMQEANERLQNQAEELQAQAEELQTQTEELNAQAEELRAANEELRNSEQALREAHARVASVARFPDENPNPVARVSADGIVLYCNPTAVQLPGWACRLGRPLSEPLLPLVAEAMAEGRVVHTDVPLEERFYSVSVAPLVREGYANIYGRDVTERRRAEAALRDSEQRLNRAQEIAHLGSWELDLSTGALTWSDEVYRIFGLQPQEFGATYRAFLERVHPDDRDAVDAAYTGSLLENRDAYEIEHRVVRRDTGEVRIVYEKCEHFRDETGRLIRSVGMVHDITERKQAEEALRRSEARFKLLSETAGRLLATENPQEIVNSLCRGVMAHLDCQVFFNFLVDEETGRLHLNACAGIPEEEAHRIEWLDYGVAVCGCAARDGVRIVAEDVPANPDPHTDLVASYGLKAYACHPLLAQGKVVGTLSFGTRTRTHFSDDDLSVMKTVADQVAVAMERLRDQQALRKNEAQLQTIVENLTEGLIVSDLDGRLLHWNRAALEMHGCETLEECRRQLAEFADTFELATLDGVVVSVDQWPLSRILRGETLHDIELRIRRVKGDWRRIYSYGGTLVHDASGRPLLAVITVTDITERKEAEEDLRAGEQRLRLALEGGQMGRWQWDLANDVSFWDERMRELLGLNASTRAASRVLFAHVDRRDRNGLERLLRTVAANGGDVEAEFRVSRDCGEPAWLALRGRVIRAGADQGPKLFAVLYDITLRKQMEAELRRLNDQLEEEVQAQTEELRDTVERLEKEIRRRVVAEEQLRRRSRMLEGFFGHTITPLVFMDRDFNFVRVNEAFAKADGKTPDYFVGKNHFDLYPHEENRAIFEQVVRTKEAYIAHARPFSYPHAPERGTMYWHWQLTPLLDEAGEVQFLVLNLEDVTEQQVALQQLAHRARQLQQLTLELSQAEDRERKRLAEILHDDLQQQLAAAKFHLSLLNSRLKADPRAQAMTGQVNQIIGDAIEKSRSLSHELCPAILHQSSLGETLHWLARQMQTKHGLTVHVEALTEGGPESEALKTFMYKAAQEILFNIVKHARVREARLRLQRVGSELWLTIADRGRGFDPRSIEKAKGFGLLSIRERLELLGGRMKIRSADGKGSVFLMVLPDGGAIGQPQDAPPRTTRTGATHPGRSGIQAQTMDGRRLRVLLVDDHKVVREGLAVLLSELPDMEVVGEAGNGREAVDQAYRLKPDVVVMDVAMPLVPGDEATRQIKLHLPQTRVIALSMFEEAEKAEAMRQAGAEAYLLKTAPSEELIAAIRGGR